MWLSSASGKLKNSKDESQRQLRYKLMDGRQRVQYSYICREFGYSTNADTFLLISLTGIKHMPVHTQIHLYLLFRTDSEYM